MSLDRTRILALLALLLVPGCSKEGDDVTTFIIANNRGELSFVANGGPASGDSASVVGGGGGSVLAVSQGNIFVGQNPPPLAPILPVPPTLAQAVTSWTDVQTIASGHAVISGNITAATTGTDATLNVNTGDLWISGSLTSANNGAVETNLTINVPAGAVFFQGAVRTGRVDSAANGDSGGALVINALRVYFTGSIDTRGEINPDGPGGDGGRVTFNTEGIGSGSTSQLFSGGFINLSGGASEGIDPAGGFGGDFFTYTNASANGSIHLIGTSFILDGGSATGSGVAVGGDAGSLDLQGDGGVFFNATLTARGGGASSSDGDASGGSGGELFQNDLAVPNSGPCALFGAVDVSGGSASCGPGGVALGGNGGSITVINGSDSNFGDGTYSMRGGDSSGGGGPAGSATFQVPDGVTGDLYFYATVDVSSGSGAGEQASAFAGTFTLLTDLGDIHISGWYLLNGGNGSGAAITDGPSAGGLMFVQAGNGDATDGGSIVFRGTIVANGGSDADDSDDTDGGDGGQVEFVCNNSTGSIYLNPGSSIQLDGGHAGGPTVNPFGGFGGLLTLRTSGGSVVDGTIGGNVNLHGSILARGGLGGGFGGTVDVDTDSDVDGRGGDITLYPGATIDVSGGSGPIGGDALNDGFAGVTFPAAVRFDADGADSDDPVENGIVRNLGSIFGRGGPVGGNGGDVLFDGLDAALNVGPLPGFLDLLGSGAGFLGEFLSQ